MSSELIEGPEEPVVTLAEARIQTRSEDPEEDEDLEDLVAAATAKAEQHCSRKFVSQQWRAWFDSWPCDALKLPHPNLLSVQSVKYIDTAGVLQTLDPALYVVRAHEVPGEIVRAYGACWPSTRCEKDAVRVEYTCGFGDAADVPADARRAVLLITSHLYDFRGASDIPQSAAWLLEPYVVRRY